MPAFMRQGLSANQCVVGVYDPVPVVLYDNDIATRFNYTYLIQIDRQDGGSWTSIVTLERLPNNESCGAFDLSSVLSKALPVGDPYSEPFPASIPYPVSTSNNETRFRITIGSRSSSTAGGSLSTLWTDVYYVVGVASRFLTEFDPWGTLVIENFVLKQTGSNKQLLTTRNTERFRFGGQNYTGYVVRIPRRDVKFSFSYLSTDLTAPFDTDAKKLYVAIGVEVTIFASASVNFTAEQRVSNITNIVLAKTSTGGVMRDVHVGYPDLETYSWSSNLAGNNTWTHLFAQIRAQSDNSARSIPVLLLLDDCTHDGVQFKFMNEFGGYDYLFCKGHTSLDTEYTRESYTTSTGNWFTATGLDDDILQTNNPFARPKKSNVTLEKKKYKAQTGYIHPNDNGLVHSLLASKRVYATRFTEPRVAPSSEYYPVVITNSSFQSMYQQTDKVIEYTIEFEYANTPRPMV